MFNFTGRLDAFSEKQFKTYFNEVLASNQLSVVIDLTNVDFIDTTAIGIIIEAAKNFKKTKRDFNVVGSPRVIQSLKLLRLEEFLHLAPDLNTAISQLSA